MSFFNLLIRRISFGGCRQARLRQRYLNLHRASLNIRDALFFLLYRERRIIPQFNSGTKLQLFFRPAKHFWRNILFGLHFVFFFPEKTLKVPKRMASLSLKIPQITLFPHDFARQKEKMMDFSIPPKLFCVRIFLGERGNPVPQK